MADALLGSASVLEKGEKSTCFKKMLKTAVLCALGVSTRVPGEGKPRRMTKVRLLGRLTRRQSFS